MEEITYPRWMHHRTLDPVIARYEAEGNLLLSQGWAFSPAAFVEPLEDGPCNVNDDVIREPQKVIELVPKKKGGRPRKVS